MPTYKDLDTLQITEENMDELDIECEECTYFGEGEFTFLKPYAFEDGRWLCYSCKCEVIR